MSVDSLSTSVDISDDFNFLGNRAPMYYIEVAMSVIYWEIGFSRVEVGFSTDFSLIHRCSVAQNIKMI